MTRLGTLIHVSTDAQLSAAVKAAEAHHGDVHAIETELERIHAKPVMMVDHIDGDPHNHRIENLKIVPLEQYDGGTEYDQRDDMWVMAFYIVLVSLVVGGIGGELLRKWLVKP